MATHIPSIRVAPLADQAMAGGRDHALHDNFRCGGPVAVRETLAPAHPVEHIQKTHDTRQREIQWKMLELTQGSVAPRRLQTEINFALEMSRPSALPQSNIMLDTLLGRDDTFDFQDAFGNMGVPETVGDPHEIMERRVYG